MKTEAAIRHKLKQVRFRHLKKRMEADLHCSPENCIHHTDALLRLPTLGGTMQVGVCGHESLKGSICDTAAYGNRDRTCPLFQLAQTKEQSKDAFVTELSSMALPEIAAQYPDMAALLWALSEDMVTDSSVEDPDAPPQPTVDDTEFRRNWAESQRTLAEQQSPEVLVSGMTIPELLQGLEWMVGSVGMDPPAPVTWKSKFYTWCSKWAPFMANLV